MGRFQSRPSEESRKDVGRGEPLSVGTWISVPSVEPIPEYESKSREGQVDEETVDARLGMG